jgi:branched-chain amino acid transport system permease protein
MILNVIVNGLLMGFVFALVALGLAIIFGVMEIVNFAHGEFLMVGMYAAYLTATILSVEPLLGLPLAALIGFLLGIVSYYLLIRYLLRGPMLAQLLGTFALMIFLRYLAMFIFGTDYYMLNEGILIGKSCKLGPCILPSGKLGAAGLSVISFFIIYGILHHTKFGSALRATSLDTEAASIMGINTERMRAMAWGLGGLAAGLAGALLTNFYYIYPTVGLLFTMIAFTIVALGGFGSIEGAFVGGLIIGLVETVGGYYTGPEWKFSLIYLIYFLVVVLRPQGLFGWRR